MARDRAENQALSERSHRRGMGADRPAAAEAGPARPQAGRRSREVLNAIRYISRSGGGWRMLPKDFPPWQRVYWWFRRFVRLMLFRTIHDIALMMDRERQGREASPSAGVIDSEPGFRVLPRRWVVERTFGWLTRWRSASTSPRPCSTSPWEACSCDGSAIEPILKRTLSPIYSRCQPSGDCNGEVTSGRTTPGGIWLRARDVAGVWG